MLSDSILSELRQLEARSLTILSDFQSALDESSGIKVRAEELRRSHSNSAFGDHAFTYYRGFRPPPRGFDVDWGHLDGFSGKHNQEWIVYGLEELLGYVYGDTPRDKIEERNRQLHLAALELRDRAFDLLALVEEAAQGTVGSRAAEIRSNIATAWERSSALYYVNQFLKSAPKITRDSSNFLQGMRIPVHVCALAQLHFLEQTKEALSTTANACRRVLLVSELATPIRRVEQVPSKVFIGHGRSLLWRELQAYIEGELRLSTEEFNSEPVAGLSTQSRLNDMLQNSAMAFLVMTAEDAQADGSLRARENVIHEVGLFQGRLGWTKALVLLEEGCSEFSNLHGINHLPFRLGSIGDTFVDVRRALAREGLVSR